MYGLLADAVVLVHGMFIVFVVFGGLLAFRWRWAPFVHVPAALWGIAIEWFGWLCPLTPLENALRRAGGGAGYSGGFIDRYLTPVIYPDGLTREIQLVLGVVLVAMNVVVYGAVIQRARRRRTP